MKGSVELLNKIKGGLFGVAIGDALGASVEFMTPKQIIEKHGVVTEILGGGMFGFHKGEVTDDTDMTLCVAKGILKNPLFPIEDIGEEFLKWQKGRPKDIGMTVQYALSFYSSSDDWEMAAKQTHTYLGEKSAGNGTLMRTLPIALAYKNIEKIITISTQQSKMTHYDDLANEACVIYNKVAHRLLLDEELKKAIHEEVQGTRYEHVLSTEPTCVPDGYVVHTMEWVVYSLLHTSSFEEAVQFAVNLGYDADTVGAITGGLAGIYYGYDTLPIRYVNDLLIKEELEDISIQLYNLRGE